MWLIFHISGKTPSLNKLLNNLLNEKDICVEISEINFPGIPQYEAHDCFRALMILAVSSGEVLMESNNGTLSFSGSRRNHEL